MTLGAAIVRWRQDRNRTKGEKPSVRLAVLKKWAAVIVDGDTRTVAERRRAFKKGFTLPREWKPGFCWVCRRHRLLIRHHVIQLQNGGNSWHLNVERICRECHCCVHPWMEYRTEHIADDARWEVPF
jgi:RNase P subunit RPR2